MLFTKMADKNIPVAAKKPPNNVVFRSPMLSVRIPDTGDKRNVVPIVKDPTNAKIETKCIIFILEHKNVL